MLECIESFLEPVKLPWSELGFEFRPTKSHLRMVYKDGKWGEAEMVEVGSLSNYHVYVYFTV